MEQYKIWDYYQNEGLHERVFSEARQRFMVRYLTPGQAVLNIGVGSGALERLARARHVNIHSVDPGERAIARLRRELGMGDRARRGYAQGIPFADRQFDGVVMCEVLEHLDDDVLHEALREVLRVLKPGGFLLVSTPYREDLRANTAVCPDCGKVFHRVGHAHSFDRARMKELLVRHGYLIEKMYLTTFVDWRRKGAWSFVKSVIRSVLARLGEAIADPHIVALSRSPPDRRQLRISI